VRKKRAEMGHHHVGGQAMVGGINGCRRGLRLAISLRSLTYGPWRNGGRRRRVVPTSDPDHSPQTLCACGMKDRSGVRCDWWELAVGGG